MRVVRLVLCCAFTNNSKPASKRCVKDDHQQVFCSAPIACSRGGQAKRRVLPFRCKHFHFSLALICRLILIRLFRHKHPLIILRAGLECWLLFRKLIESSPIITTQSHTIPSLDKHSPTIPLPATSSVFDKQTISAQSPLLSHAPQCTCMHREKKSRAAQYSRVNTYTHYRSMSWTCRYKLQCCTIKQQTCIPSMSLPHTSNLPPHRTGPQMLMLQYIKHALVCSSCSSREPRG